MESIDNDGDGLSEEELLDGLDNDGDGRIDEDPGPMDPALCEGPWRRVGVWESSLERYPNEEEDVNLDRAASSGRCDPVYLKAIQHMDGLPDLVEIEIWVLDQERRELSPRYLSTRVQIPSRRQR